MWNRPAADGDAPTLPDMRAHPIGPSAVPPLSSPPPPPMRRKPTSTTARVTNKVSQVINLVTDIAEAALFLRIILIFLAADPGAGFANLVYGLSAPLVAPFQGLFPGVVIAQGEVDLAAIVAMIAYALGARILQTLVRLLAHW